jgi:diketogulonate reductase-like aldo/keto reductase
MSPQKPAQPTAFGQPFDRRSFLAAATASGVGLSLGITPAHADISPKTGPAISGPAISGPAILRAIPGTAERIPAIGMGTWITFNVGGSRRLRDGRAEVLRTFFDRGGTVVDSSPMYGSAEDVIGYCLDKIGKRASLFGATKVWTPLIADGEDQMAESRTLWGVEKFDLMQVHNLVNWEGHLETLADDKAAGRVRHIGITTSHGSRHSQMARVMADPRVDAVQLTYNIVDRSAEQHLLPLAAERGLAVVINRPFRRGELFRRFAGHPLPEWAAEIGCTNWAQFFLKFVISHPAVTCAVPATSQVSHMNENMGALYGALPDTAMRARMIRYTESL